MSNEAPQTELSELRSRSSLQRYRLRQERLRSFVRALVATVVIGALLVTIVGLLVSRNLGRFAGRLLEEQAEESLNGRLEYASLELDLAGRAQLRDVRIYLSGEEEALLTVERATATIDLLTFFGPNRGGRALALQLRKPILRLVRKADGSFNAANLFKPRDPNEPQQDVGVALRISDGLLDFTDHCLLGQAYPEFSADSGPASQLLTELGYTREYSGPPTSHRESFGINGRLLFNPRREEAEFALTLPRTGQGGQLKGKGLVRTDGSSFDLDFELTRAELGSLAAYLMQPFPKLDLRTANTQDGVAGPKVPRLAGVVERLRLQLVQAPKQELQLVVSADVRQVRLAGTVLPDVYLPECGVTYDAKRQRAAASFKLSMLGLTLSGKPAMNLKSGELSGVLNLAAFELPQLQAKLRQPALPLQGKLSAVVELGGTAEQPLLRAKLASEMLRYEKLRLGQVAGGLVYDNGLLRSDKLTLSGGELPVALTGSLDLKKQSGKLSLSASNIELAQAADIAQRMGKAPAGRGKRVDARGKLNLKADVTLVSGKPHLAYRVWSKELEAGELQLRSADASGSLVDDGLQIAALTGLLVSKEPLQTPLFSSTEALRMNLRAGGRIDALSSSKPQLSLNGKAESQNLQPAQVSAAFKASGALDDPEIRLQLKGPVDGEAVVLSINGRFRAGLAPVAASLTWKQTQIIYDGKLDLTGQQLDGRVQARAVDLARFSGRKELAGVASVEADVDGRFNAINVAGKVSAPIITYTTTQRRYDIKDLSAGFKLAEGNRVSVIDGVLIFEGNRLHAEGVLGKVGGDLTIASDSFNLLSAIALLPPEAARSDGQVTKGDVAPLSIKSQGPLVVRLTGTLKDPKAEVNYQSGPGSVHGHSFVSAVLRGSSTLTAAHLDKLEVRSAEGRVAAEGDYIFKEGSFKTSATLDSFDVGVLTPLLGAAQLAELRGKLNGSLSLSGTTKSFALTSDLSLAEGSFRGHAIEQATARLKADADGLEVQALEIRSHETSLSATGSVPRDRARASFDLTAPKVELGLIQPFLPRSAPELGGSVKLKVVLRPGKGELPEADIEIQDSGKGISLAGRQIDSAAAQARIRGGQLQLQQLDLGVGKSSLRVSGSANLRELGQAGRGTPLDLAVEASNFNLADVLPLLPERQRKLLPSGVVTAKPLRLSGTAENPLLSGTVSFALSKMPEGLPSSVTSVGGNISFSDNSFKIVSVDIGTAERGSAGSFGQAQITGEGRVALNPPRLVSGAVNIDLSPAAAGGRFVKLTQDSLLAGSASRAGSFDGTLGGTISLVAAPAGEQAAAALISGRLVITEAGGSSMLVLPTPESGGGSGEGGTQIRNLQVEVQPGTEVRYRPGVDLRASITGGLQLNGVPGLTAGNPAALAISGQLRLSKGSLMLYRHTIRLDESTEATLRFSGRPGDLAPSFTGRGVIILPNVLSGTEAHEAGMPGATGLESTMPSARTSRDLKVFFNFKDLKLTADREGEPEVSLTSDPPKSQTEILRYLAGGVGELIAGHGDFEDIAESELIGFGSSWVSRQLEGALGVDALRFGGVPSDDSNPFYMDVEKELNPEVSLTYYRNFFSATNTQEEFGLKYRPFREQLDNSLQGLEIRLNLQNDSFRGQGSEFMFTWSKRF